MAPPIRDLIDEDHFVEGKVDRRYEHVVLHHREDSEATPIVAVAPLRIVRPARNKNIYLYEQLLDSAAFQSESVLSAVAREMMFYLVERGIGWAYVRHHAGTSANIYSKVWWGLMKGDRLEELGGNAIIAAVGVDAFHLFRAGEVDPGTEHIEVTVDFRRDKGKCVARIGPTLEGPLMIDQRLGFGMFGPGGQILSELSHELRTVLGNSDAPWGSLLTRLRDEGVVEGSGPRWIWHLGLR